MDIPVFTFSGEHHSAEAVPFHTHPGTELLFVAQSECPFRLADGTCLNIPQGDALVLPAGCSHARPAVTEKCRILFTLFECTEPGTASRVTHFRVGNDDLLRVWFEQLLTLGREHQIRQASLLLATIRSRLLMFEHAGPPAADRHPRVRAALEEMQRNYTRSFSVSELAERIGVSHSHLNFLFRKEFGTGPLGILTALRMARARQLLLERRYNIAEVALKSGFQDTNYFTRLFRKYHGVTPGEFRNNPATTGRNGTGNRLGEFF